MTKTLNTKHVEQHTDENGTVWPETTLLRYTDENGEGGCWYESIERAEVSWQRWIDGAPGRARRRTESARLREAVSANAGAADPFARFDA
jgi:hypothetical protein